MIVFKFIWVVFTEIIFAIGRAFRAAFLNIKKNYKFYLAVDIVWFVAIASIFAYGYIVAMVYAMIRGNV